MQAKIFLSVLGFLLAHALSAQKKDTVLWFVGKWENKTFKIDSALSGGTKGGTVIIKPDGSFVITTSGNKAWNKRLNDGLGHIEKGKQQIINGIRNDQGLIQYNLGIAIKKELDKVKETFEKYKTDWPEENDNAKLKNDDSFDAGRQTTGAGGGIYSAEQRENWCTEKRFIYDRIINFAKQHKNDKQFRLPPPPVADYDCWGCDAEKRRNYDTAVSHYIKEFFAEEKELNEGALDILKGIQQLKSITGNNIPDLENHPDCKYLNEYELSEAINIIVERGTRRAEQLFSQNRNNYTALYLVVRVYLAALKQAQLLGLRESDQSVFTELGESLKDFYEIMRDRMIKEKDYSQMVNIPFMLGTLASMKLCGNNYYENEWQALLNFCRFRLTYELDAKVGKQTENGAGYAVSHYKGVARVVPDLDSAGCLRFFLAKEEQQNIHLDLIANEVIAPQRPVYIGTKKGKSPMPDIRLHFCKKDIDTIAFVYSQPDGEGIWDYGGRRIRGWIQANEGIFKNIDELTDAAKDLAGKAGGLAAGMKVNAEEMKKKVAELQKNGKSSQEIAIEMKKMLSGEAIPAEMNELLKVTFIVNVNNRNSILVNQKFDARQINPKMNDVIEYGYMTIKFEHDPKK